MTRNEIQIERLKEHVLERRILANSLQLRRFAHVLAKDVYWMERWATCKNLQDFDDRQTPLPL